MHKCHKYVLKSTFLSPERYSKVVTYMIYGCAKVPLMRVKGIISLTC